MARPIEKRAQIEAGLIRAVAQYGLFGATVQRIARAGQVSPGLLYRYWKDRDQLARRAYRRLFSNLMGHLLAVAADQPGFWGRIRVMVTQFYDYAEQQPREVQFLLLTQHDLANCLPADQRILSLLNQTVTLGIRSGAIRRMDRSLATQLLLGIVLQPVIGAIYGDLARPLSHNVPDVLSALQLVLAPPPARRNGNGAAKGVGRGAAPPRRKSTRKAKHARLARN